MEILLRGKKVKGPLDPDLFVINSNGDTLKSKQTQRTITFTDFYSNKLHLIKSLKLIFKNS